MEYRSLLSFLSPALLDKILVESTIHDIPKGIEILREERYIKVLPIVIDGLVKVYSHFEDKDLLLYIYRAKAELCYDILCCFKKHTK